MRSVAPIWRHPYSNASWMRCANCVVLRERSRVAPWRTLLPNSRSPVKPDFPLPRFGTKRDYSRETLGPAVGVVMTMLGQPPMPWQQYVLDVACEIDPVTGKFFYREVRLIVMRQQGKTTLLLGKAAHRCLAWPAMRLVYTAQTRNMARRR